MKVDEIRAKAQHVAARVKSDPEYRSRVEADPVGMLKEAGIPDPVIPQLLRENMGGPEVEGYVEPVVTQVPPDGCTDTTCWISFCPDSCIVTMPDF